jgi:hypothetical protein
MTEVAPRIATARAYLRARGAAIGVEVVVNFAGPFVIFNLARHALGDAGALMASSGPPIAWSLVEFLRRRRVDALSLLVLTGIALSLLAYIGGGGVRFLQLREKLVTGLIGLIFLGSAAIGRPLIYQLAHATMMRRSQTEADELVALRDNIYFKRTMMVMTLVWGCGLVAEAVTASALVFALPITQFLLVSPVVGYGTMGALTLWTAWYARRARRLGAARRAAAEAAEALDADPPEAG